jgi:hypothetical protein
MKSTLLHYASNGNLDKIKRFADAGLFLSAIDYLGRSALHLAVEGAHAEVVELLIARAADVNCRDNLGDTPISIAARKGDARLQAVLLRAGALSEPATPHPVSRSSSSQSQAPFKGASFTILQACPQPIAAAMLSGCEAAPVAREEASLFFSDVVGFTALCGTLSAAKVSRMLGDLFKRLDRLAYLHGVQKVDVVGDAYIAAANFTEDQPDDHAARLARFAVAAVAAAQAVPVDEDRPELGTLQVRAEEGRSGRVLSHYLPFIYPLILSVDPHTLTHTTPPEYMHHPRRPKSGRQLDLGSPALIECI